MNVSDDRQTDFRALWRHTHASFSVSGDFADPARITNRLGLVPSRCHGKGEAYTGHLDRHSLGLRHHLQGAWHLFSIPAVDSHDPKDHVEALVALLEPRAAALAALLAEGKYEARFWVHYAVPVGTMGYTLPSSLLTRLARLCVDVSFTHDTIADCDQSAARER
jgi:hypothetical protein